MSAVGFDMRATLLVLEVSAATVAHAVIRQAGDYLRVTDILTDIRDQLEEGG